MEIGCFFFFFKQTLSQGNNQVANSFNTHYCLACIHHYQPKEMRQEAIVRKFYGKGKQK